MKKLLTSFFAIFILFILYSHVGHAQGTTLTLTKETPLFHESSLTTEVGQNLAPQTVTVVESRSDGWYKIKTWLGDKWVAPNGVKIPLTTTAEIYNEPSFLSSTGQSIAPQTITVLDQETNGWWLVKTWLGDKWIAPDGVKLVVQETEFLYNQANFSSSTGVSIAPQTVTAIGQAEGGWWKIKSYLGDKWINIGSTSFIVPLNTTNYQFTSGYGYRTINGVTKFHRGVDLAGSGDIGVVASASGTVHIVQDPSLSGGYGEMVVIKHSLEGQVWYTLYAHMKAGSISVSPGQTVGKGQLIGKMGNTGDSSNQHLHFELHKGGFAYNTTYTVNPADYIDF